MISCKQTPFPFPFPSYNETVAPTFPLIPSDLLHFSLPSSPLRRAMHIPPPTLEGANKHKQEEKVYFIGLYDGPCMPTDRASSSSNTQPRRVPYVSLRQLSGLREAPDQAGSAPLAFFRVFPSPAVAISPLLTAPRGRPWFHHGASLITHENLSTLSSIPRYK